MGANIEIEDIRQYSRKYQENSTNKVIENTITKNGLENSCIKQEIIMQNQPIFNIELPETKRYDQKDSFKCWIYAGINMIKYNMADNLNIDINQLELSINYLSFFDKLEKSNSIYERIIQMKSVDLSIIHQEDMVKYAVSEGGYWQEFVAIITKYGIVPSAFMPDVVESTQYEKIEELYTEKVKKDIILLLDLKKNNASIEELREEKQKFLQENYNFLSKVLGEPVQRFTFEYRNKEDKIVVIDNISPIEFKEKFLTLKLDDFVCIGNLPMYNKEYGKVYRKKYLENVKDSSFVQFLNLPIKELERLAIQQLKDGIPVYMGAHIRKFRDIKSGVLDLRLYNYQESLGMKFLDKRESLDLYDIEMHHAMSFCGVHIVNEKPQRWKIEDSYGDKQKVKGYYVMNENFFERFVLSVVVDKKYLTPEQLLLLQQDPIEYDVDDPF